jgi:hypothetical protein
LKKPHALIGLLAAVGTAIGVLVAVVGLPYGRLNYTAFAGLYHEGGATFAGAGHYAIDAVPGGAVDESASTGAATHTVDVVFEDNSAAGTIGAFQFTIRNDNSTSFDADSDPAAFTGNPDFNEAGPGASGTWDCTLSSPSPEDDTGAFGVGQEEHRLACFVSSGSGPAYAMATGVVMASIDYTTGALGTSNLTFTGGVVGDNGGIELVNCDGPDGIPGNADDPCFGADLNLIPPPSATPTDTATNTNTPTNTPTSTPTPAGPTVNKIPEWCFPGVVNNQNADCAVPSANLYLCQNGPCAGPGEGELIVHEYATNIDTAPAGAGGPGLGAYEFDIEYDNFVISSLNPEDIVFRAPPGSVAPYPNGADATPDGEGSARAPANCSMTIITENVVHFGCVTTGPAPAGPEGDMDLARLTLEPHEDLDNDIFPGNDNGVITIIKDNGCETVDVFGHPTLGSVNGGLTIECGDLAVTVRILEGDLDLDCDVDIQDQQLIAFRYGSFFGSLLYSQWFDLEPNLHDLDIDIKDLQKVFGRDGSTCQNPVPAQTPVPFIFNP